MSTYEILKRAQRDPLTPDPRGLFHQRYRALARTFDPAFAAWATGLAPNAGLTPSQGGADA